MGDTKELSLVFWEKWSVMIKGSDHNNKESRISTTEDSLIDVLSGKENSEEFIAKLQELQLTKKKEEYEKLKPEWFEFAPQLFQQKRKELKSVANEERLQWFHDNVSYNTDGNMNILKLHKTFCKDVSGTGQRCNWEDAKALAESKWYALLTDYNECDSDEVKQQSDWYKVINIFSNGYWDTTDGMELFRDMTWCDSRYWTATLYKNEKWEEVNGVARSRLLNTYYCRSYWADTDGLYRVCGFKPAP